MSTRSQIKFKNSEFNIHVYKHCDGYPEGVLPTLVPFVKEFFADRGDDECYFLAQLVRRFAIEDYKEHKDDEYCNPEKSFTGWGLDCVQHGDIEYLYEIDTDGSIYVNGKKLTKAQLTKWSKNNASKL